ncbi:MAG: RNA polymerase sigma factor [Chitinophagales bacterium]|nr:RNA polymerase sigma factor [Chitinophagales bacterium]HMV13747.1 RNA polymerase sigma factor [Chitinophagales bacterium]HMW11920.1 RNA polymerase sigma factor [Chitinophagales bacterium]HMX59546.1 RNA polymerase sigma factor [Chitinophagales bacterium]HMY24458.1 RNA polymerase sigma factor [Chitinophagales bacterium]
MQPIEHKETLYNELIELCKRNNREAQYKLYSLLSSKMFAVCIRYAKNKEAAEDLLQEGFVKVFTNIDKFRADGSFEGWVRRIMVNTAIEQYRKNTKMYPVVSADDIKIDIPETETSDNLEVEDLMKMINSLSHGYKTIFNLYVIEGFSHKEIADMLNISEGTSKSQLARARYLLMEMVNKSAIVKRNATASE